MGIHNNMDETMGPDENTHSYWQRSHGEYHPNPALEGDIKVDVVIVGGGFTGLSTAWHLKTADPGMSMAVLEADVIGFGASGRNGGFLSQAFGLAGLTDLRFGRQRMLEGLQYVDRAVEYVKEIISTHKFDCDFLNCDFVSISFKDFSKRTIDKLLKDFDNVGVGDRVSIRDRAWLEQEFGSPLFQAGIELRKNGRLNPIKLVRELKRLALSSGVDIYEHTRADLIKVDNKVTIQTAKGKVTADKCVLATNAYTHLLEGVPQLKRKQIPAWSYQIVTEPLTSEQWDAIGWKNKQGLNTMRTNLHYFSNTPDGRIMFGGGGDIGFAYGKNMNDKNEKAWAKMQFQLESMFPVLAGVKIADKWGGPCSINPEMTPAIGFTEKERIIYSFGYCGHGVALAHLNGKTISDLLLEVKSDLTDVWFVNRKTMSMPPSWITYPFCLLSARVINLMDAYTEIGVWKNRP